jgi:hypothetical protein
VSKDLLIRTVHTVDQKKGGFLVTLLGVEGHYAAVGTVKAGEAVIVLPTGTILPEDLHEFLNSDGRIVGVKSYQVRPTSLGSRLTRGVVVSTVALEQFHPGISTKASNIRGALGISEVGDVEPPYLMIPDTHRLSLHDALGLYDVDDAGQHMDVVSALLRREVVVTEKIDGYHFAATADRDGRLFTSTHKNTVGDRAFKHPYTRVLFNQRIDFMLREIQTTTGAETVSVRGEFVNECVGEKYGHEEDRVYLFELELNGQPVGAATAFTVFSSYSALTVPVLSSPGQSLKQWLGERSITEAANGRSRIGDCNRQGIVIRPAIEMNHPSIGRVILKSNAS